MYNAGRSVLSTYAYFVYTLQQKKYTESFTIKDPSGRNPFQTNQFCDNGPLFRHVEPSFPGRSDDGNLIFTQKDPGLVKSNHKSLK